LAACGTFGVFCAASSATYLVNDCIDIEADRHHPQKARRPIASGALAVAPALMMASVLVTAALVGSWLIAGWELAAVAGSYLAVSTAYTLYLKHQPVFEIAAIAAGFVLRAVAGGVATHVPLSNWFLVVASFTALFVTVGKRTAEHRALADSRGDHRPVLESYTPSFLQATLVLTATVTVTGYCLWAFGRSGLTSRPGVHAIWIELSVIPVILGVLVVLQLLDAGRGSAPEELFLKNRPVQMLALCWIVLLAVGVYA